MAKKEKKTPVQPIRTYLIKSAITKYVDALGKDIECQEFALKRGIGLTGRLFLRKPQSSSPKWVKFLQTGVDADLPKLESWPSAAVLLLKVQDRLVAMVFGMGRYMLRDTAYEADFGILSALNAVSPTELRSADTYHYEAVSVHKRTQTSRTTSISDFAIDPTREHFRSVTGTAREKEFAERVTGTEGGLGTNVRVTFADLKEHCEKALTAYKSKAYLKTFPKYDNLLKVADKAKIAELEERLIKSLRKQNTSGMNLSPPEPLDYDDFSGFSFTPKGDIHDELSLDEFLATRRDLDELDLEALKGSRIFLRRETSDSPLAKWSVYKSLICEFRQGQLVYILMNGEWHRISRTFAKQVEDYVSGIPVVDVGLPDPVESTTEPEYLEEVEAASGGFAVMDRKLAYCEDAGHGIEVCDVLTAQRDHVHIKRREGGSASLSHLFNQGRNSAFALLRDAQFRVEARSHLKDIDATYERRIPKAKPTMGSFRVVYAIMGRFQDSIAAHLPFFSKLSLKTVAEELAERGVEVALAKIEVPQS